ncbi:MAG: bifunctional glutamate N-acetyltransferase/amino-acid acetyltransferase ArgJ [Clostridiaceae bacterium]|nr:bifunctional glutamate N-acetyltransferase/amino-acid acetyltransferase ArgJ [Clostridiaceae bacterium]
MEEKYMNRSGITAPLGFKATGVSCGIKKNGQKDLALVISDINANAAGIFTKNIVKGHSLKWTQEKIKHGTAKVVVINSGCANACVGVQGDKDAEKIAGFAASLAGCKPEEVMLGSTGVIGYPLDIEKIKNGLKKAFDQASTQGYLDCAQAIMTTDTFPKQTSKTFSLDGKTVTIGGMAKGSGMIHPNMATMISVITTDVNISSQLLDKALKTVADSSFNRISVDGDTSVCDKVIILANGMAGNSPITCEGEEYHAFLDALLEVSVTLSKMLAKDGEGATKLIEIRVENCSDRKNAHLILNAVAKSPLVKTAIFGNDANWGRIFTAAGYSGAKFDPDNTDIYLGDLLVCKNGIAYPFDEEKALDILKKEEITIVIDLKNGNISDHIWTCDLTYDYIKINGSYRT